MAIPPNFSSFSDVLIKCTSFHIFAELERTHTHSWESERERGEKLAAKIAHMYVGLRTHDGSSGGSDVEAKIDTKHPAGSSHIAFACHRCCPIARRLSQRPTSVRHKRPKKKIHIFSSPLLLIYLIKWNQFFSWSSRSSWLIGTTENSRTFS